MNLLGWILRGASNRPSSRLPEAPRVCLQLLNLTRNTVLATSLEVADTAAKRSKGLLGRASLSEGEGLWIRPCEAVHTFWMQFPIDLIYLDRKKRIRKLVASVPPWRLSGCLTAHSILELPAGTIHKTQTQRGDALDFSAAQAGSYLPTDAQA